MQAVLVNPPLPGLPEEEKELNLSTAYLAGALRAAGFSASIIDASLHNLSVEQTVQQILYCKARLVGISFWMHRMLPEVAALVDKLRQAGFAGHICLGGHTPTFAYQELLSAWPGVDSIALGEGETLIVELAQTLADEGDWRQVPGLVFRDGDSRQVVTSAPRDPVVDLDMLPQPAWDLVPEVSLRGQFISVATSRGCYGRCTFCSINSFYRSSCSKPWRGHSPERVLAELETLVQQYGAQRIGFRDDNFIGPGRLGQERARAIAQGIKQRGLPLEFYVSCRSNDIGNETFALLKEAGLKRVFLGIESGQQAVLDWFNKLTTVEENERALSVLRELEIPVTIGFIMFRPQTTWAEFRANLSFLFRQFDDPAELRKSINDLFNALEIYPGTELVTVLQDAGLLNGSVMEGYTYRFSDWRIRLLHRLVQWLRRRQKRK